MILPDPSSMVPTELVAGPVFLPHGLIARIVGFADGSGAVQSWDLASKSWRSGEDAEADTGDVFSSPFASIEVLRAAGVPKSDWGPRNT